MPGKSTKVKLTTFPENIFKLIGSTQIPLLAPAILSVSSSISLRMSLKSLNILFFVCKNTPHSSNSRVPSRALLCSLSSLGQYTSCKINGLLVTIPVPLGKNDRPTRLSMTELFPELFKPNLKVRKAT